MPRTVEGVYRNGKMELFEISDDIAENTHFIVTFIADGPITLSTFGIDHAHAAD